MNVKTVVISLPHEEKRNEFIKKEMEKCGLTDYIIMDGVDGNNIIEIPLVPPHISKLFYTDKSKIYDSRMKLDGTGLKKGEMGCAWSHLNVYDMLLKDDKHDAYLVFEDDAELIVSLDELTLHLDELKNLSFDVCHIFYSQWFDFNRIKQISNNYWIPERKFFNNAGAYIVTKSGAKKLLDASYPYMGLPADDLISNLYVFDENFDVIVPSKFLFKPKGFESSIHKINDSSQQLSLKNFEEWLNLGNKIFQNAYLKTLFNNR